jgi:hypothetical protein
LRADLFVHALEVDFRILADDKDENAALLVLDEQVLGVPAGDVAAQGRRFLDGEKRRVLNGLEGNGEAFEIGEEVFRRGGDRSGRVSGQALAPGGAGGKPDQALSL